MWIEWALEKCEYLNLSHCKFNLEQKYIAVTCKPELLYKFSFTWKKQQKLITLMYNLNYFLYFMYIIYTNYFIFKSKFQKTHFCAMSSQNTHLERSRWFLIVVWDCFPALWLLWSALKECVFVLLVFPHRLTFWKINVIDFIQSSCKTFSLQICFLTSQKDCTGLCVCVILSSLRCYMTLEPHPLKGSPY